MVVKTDRSNESLAFVLGDRAAYAHFCNAVNMAKDGSSVAFKRELGTWMLKLGLGISGALVSPKMVDVSLEGAILYLALSLSRSPKLYGRLHYYFTDPDFVSIDEGCTLYNALIGQLSKAIDYPDIERLYIRVIIPRSDYDEEARAYTFFGKTRVDVSCHSRCHYDPQTETWHPRLVIEFTEIDDPKAVARVALLDEISKGRSKEYVIPMTYEDSVRKEFVFDLSSCSLGLNHRASIGAEVTFARRESKLDENGRAILKSKKETKRIVIGVYLKDDKSEK